MTGAATPEARLREALAALDDIDGHLTRFEGQPRKLAAHLEASHGNPDTAGVPEDGLLWAHLNLHADGLAGAATAVGEAREALGEPAYCGACGVAHSGDCQREEEAAS